MSRAEKPTAAAVPAPPGQPRLLLRNGRVLDYYPLALHAEPAPRVADVDLRVNGERIVERGPGLLPAPGEEIVDLQGAVVLPGAVNAHTHLYAALAPGMPAPRQVPRSFTDILTEIWWPLDRALDPEAVELSAAAGAWEAARCGTTLLFDHHSSLTCVGGSLDRVEAGVARVGLRACLCYEVTDRGGPGSRDTALEENERYLRKVAATPAAGASGAVAPTAGVPRFKGIAGAHASFTLEDETLKLLSELCDAQGVGVHMHLAEGPTDREVSQERGWKDPLERLLDAGLVRRGSIFAHGVDLTPIDLQALEEQGAWLVHNGRSNMNNGVGRAPVDRFPSRAAFGTDGLDDNMWSEMRATFYRGNEPGRGPLGFRGAQRFWLGGYRLARETFGEPFGTLDTGAPADLIVCSAFQKVPLLAENWLSVILFGFRSGQIAAVYVGGRLVYRAGGPAPVDPRATQAAARRIWETMGSIRGGARG